MPVLESTDHITPKSVIRHRPIGEESNQFRKRSNVTTAATPIVQRASRPKTKTTDVEADDINEWQRTDDDEHDPITNAQTQIPPRRASAATTAKPVTRSTPLPPLPKAARKGMIQHAHPLLYLGLGMLGMLILWSILTGVIGWYNTTMDNIHYGYPRTYQTDAFVGHNEASGVPSHFIAINLRGHIEVIEMPGGDATHARIFLGPQLFSVNSDLVVVTLEFRDVNGDHRPDMIIDFQGSQVVFINDQGTFRPLRPDERHEVEQFLQHPVQ